MDVQEHDINYSSPEFLSTASWRYTDILLHHPTSSHIPQKHAVHICKTVQYTVVTCSLVLDDYGNLKGSQLKALLTGLEAPPNSLNPIWKATFCMTGWSHAFPSPNATLQKVPQLIKKNTESDSMIPSQHLSLWSKPRSRKSSWSIESVRNGDCLGFSEESEAKFSRRNIDPMFWRPTFHWMAWFFEEGKLSIPSFHQSKTPRKQKRYLNISSKVSLPFIHGFFHFVF